MILEIEKDKIKEKESKECIYNYKDDCEILLISSPLIGINAFGFSNLLFITKEKYYFLEDLGYFFEYIPYKIICIKDFFKDKYIYLNLRDNSIKYLDKVNLKNINEKIIFYFINGKKYSIFSNKYGFIFGKRLNINLKGIIIIPSLKRVRLKFDINELMENYIEKIIKLKIDKSSWFNYCPIRCKVKNYYFLENNEINPLLVCKYLYNIYKDFEDFLLELVNCNYDQFKKFKEWLNSRKNGK